MQSIPNSELVLNPDGSVYHLNLLPEDLAPIVITVGDPDRVKDITKYFERIEVSKEHREFKTQTGSYMGTRITVISTGIGTDNIDIVLNELDALVNIDLESRTLKRAHTELTFVRVGTSGAIQSHIPVGSFLISEMAIGFDNLLHYYKNTSFLDTAFSEALVQQLGWGPPRSAPYVVAADELLMQRFQASEFIKGNTATNVGFYGPQGRVLRLALNDHELIRKLQNFHWNGASIDNMEMETSAIYGLARLLGHKAISLNAILANRATGDFSENPAEIVDALIKKTLESLVV